MAINTGSVQINASTPLQDLFDKENSFARKFENETGVSFYRHMNQMATAARAIGGLTPSTAELNKLDNFTASTPVYPVGLKIPASGSYGFYIRQKRVTVPGSHRWTGIGMTRVLGAWCSLISGTPIIGAAYTWPNAPSRFKFLPTLSAATQLVVQHISVNTGPSFIGAGTPFTFSTPIYTNIYALGY